MFCVFWRFSDEPVTENDSMFANGENESLFKVWKREYALKIETDRAELFLALTIEFWIDFNLMAFIFELQCRFIYGLRKN